jgi:uncharacterized protein YdaU (DUF1376 family)
MSRPWMPMYWGDYLRDTGHLTTVQHGTYLLLIAHYWNHGALPTDHASLKRIAGLHGAIGENTWRSICLAIAPFFDENWRHKRIDAELEKVNNISAKRAFAGSRGGSASRGKNNGQRFAVQAIAKQAGGKPQSKKDNTSTNSESEIGAGSPQAAGEKETKPIVSSHLAASLHRRGWA